LEKVKKMGRKDTADPARARKNHPGQTKGRAGGKNGKTSIRRKKRAISLSEESRNGKKGRREMTPAPASSSG